jgi:prolipoprotein diacylglyceryltransferase
MNPLILIGVAVIWYATMEFVISRLRRASSMPTKLTFWLGLAQSIGAFGFVVSAAIAFLLYRK